MTSIVINSGPFVLTSVRFSSLTTILVSFNYPPDAGLAGYTLTVGGNAVAILAQAPGSSVYETELTVPAQPPDTQATLTVSALVTTGGAPVTPGSFDFFTPSTNAIFQESLVQGASNDAAADILRRFLPPIYRNKPAWEALIAALASGDATVNENAIATFNQLFLSSAVGNYLIDRAADQGIRYPGNAGLTEESFRKLSILLANNRQIHQALLGILEAFYGYDSTHARLESARAGPFSLTAGDTWVFNVDDRQNVTVRVQASDYDNLNAATATEVAAVISRAFRDAKCSAFAISKILEGQDKVVVYSGSIGLLGSLTVTGGLANEVTRFPNQIGAFDDPLGVPVFMRLLVAPDEFRLVWQNTYEPLSLYLYQPGNYVNITCVNAPELRGSYEVLDIHIDCDPGTLDYSNRSWISIRPTVDFPYTTVNGPGTVFTPLGSDIRFFQPTRQTVVQNANSAFVAQVSPDVGLDVILPATTQAIGRAADAAAYLHENSGAVDSVGPFLRDPYGLAVTATETTSSVSVARNRGISTLLVASTAGFPTSECWIAMGFGTRYEVGPIRCLRAVDGTTLALDASYIFPKAVPSGSSVILLASKGGFDPVQSDHTFVLTDSSAGRIAASNFIDESKAAGVQVNKVVVYPGDRGLAGQGDPVTGSNLSDTVAIWAGDDVDAAVEAAHNA